MGVTWKTFSDYLISLPSLSPSFSLPPFLSFFLSFFVPSFLKLMKPKILKFELFSTVKLYWNILDNASMIGCYGGNRSLPLGKYLVRRPCWLMFVHMHCRICLLCYSTPDFKLFPWRWIDYVDEPWLLCLKKFFSRRRLDVNSTSKFTPLSLLI